MKLTIDSVNGTSPLWRQPPKRQYHVLEGQHYHIVFSPKNDETGNYTIVPKKAVHFIVKKLGGRRGVTKAEALDACRGSKYFPDRFSVLNALYVLVGVKRASIARQDGTKLFFNIWKGGI